MTSFCNCDVIKLGCGSDGKKIFMPLLPLLLLLLPLLPVGAVTSEMTSENLGGGKSLSAMTFERMLSCWGSCSCNSRDGKSDDDVIDDVFENASCWLRIDVGSAPGSCVEFCENELKGSSPIKDCIFSSFIWPNDAIPVPVDVADDVMRGDGDVEEEEEGDDEDDITFRWAALLL